MFVNQNNYIKCLLITREIDKLFFNVKQDTLFDSSYNNILKHKDFKELVKKGDKIIPYLFKRAMQDYGFSNVTLCLLNEITKENIVPPEHQGNFNLIVAGWINWFVKSKYNNSDIYYNLLDK